MDYFKKINTLSLAEIIKSARKSLYLCLPSLPPEISDAIAELNFMQNIPEETVQIHILVDFDANTFRQGYGDYESMEGLFMEGDDIKCLKDNRISFIICDNIGYYLFIESRTMIPADKETINAVRIDPISIVRLKSYFFPGIDKTDIKDELANAIIEESKTLSSPEKLIPETPAPISEISDNDLEEVRINLEKNPPLNPDFKRKVEFYKNKFQYAELHYYGQRIEHYTISIPPKLLPYKNEELKNKLLTRLKLFENINDNEDFQKFKTIEQRKNEIIEKYLTPLKCRKNRSVLKVDTKIQFVEEIKTLTQDLGKIKTTIYSAMIDELESAKTNLQSTLEAFLIENPTDEMINMGQNNFSIMAKSISTALVSKINVDPAKMISKFKIDCHFADITFEDLSDTDLLNEFVEKKLIDDTAINKLAEFGQGIKVN